MTPALKAGWTAWEEVSGSASGSASGDDTGLFAPVLLSALPAAPLPAPLQFMNHADAAAYAVEGAPPSPPRVMSR